MDAGIRFADIVSLLLALGFDFRVRGDHYIFARTGIPDILNVQPVGGMAKRYQVAQIRRLVIRRDLGGILDAKV